MGLPVEIKVMNKKKGLPVTSKQCTVTTFTVVCYTVSITAAVVIVYTITKGLLQMLHMHKITNICLSIYSILLLQ